MTVVCRIANSEDSVVIAQSAHLMDFAQDDAQLFCLDGVDRVECP